MIVAYYGPRHTLCSASIYNLHTLHFSWYHTCLSHSASFLTLHIFFILFLSYQSHASYPCHFFLICQAFINPLSYRYCKIRACIVSYAGQIWTLFHTSEPSLRCALSIISFPFVHRSLRQNVKVRVRVATTGPIRLEARRESASIITHHPALFCKRVISPWEKRELAHSAGFWSQVIRSKCTITHRFQDLPITAVSSNRRRARERGTSSAYASWARGLTSELR